MGTWAWSWQPIKWNQGTTLRGLFRDCCRSAATIIIGIIRSPSFSFFSSVPLFLQSFRKHPLFSQFYIQTGLKRSEKLHRERRFLSLPVLSSYDLSVSLLVSTFKYSLVCNAIGHTHIWIKLTIVVVVVANMPNNAGSLSTYTTMMRVTSTGRPYCQVPQGIFFLTERNTRVSFNKKQGRVGLIVISNDRTFTICLQRLWYSMAWGTTDIGSEPSRAVLCLLRSLMCLDTSSSPM